MNLLTILLFPTLVALGILLVREGRQAKMLAFAGSLVQVLLSLYLLFQYQVFREAGAENQWLFESNLSWFPEIGIQFHLGVDGMAVLMMLLTSLVVFTGVLFSWNLVDREKEFFFLLIFLSIGAYGFFMSLDLFMMFFFLELAVIPKYMLIAIWGSGRKVYSANKLALLLMGGSALVLMGVLGIYFNAGNTFDIPAIGEIHIKFEMQKILFPLVFAGFGVFSAMFPFHTWVPDGHSSAPTAASMFLAGISMKLGGYGCIRAAVFLMPEAARIYAPWIVGVATIAIFYGAFATMMQKDLKYINAYSSVSHCGFVFLGIGMLTITSITGAIMQMVSHGLMTALFFAAIGMIYHRTHTREVSQLGGLLKVMPFISVVILLAGLASLGLPGLSGFPAEMTVFIGSWQNDGVFSRLATLLACASIVVTAVYVLRALGASIMGPLKNPDWIALKDAAWHEKVGSIVLVSAILLMGFAPFLISGMLETDTRFLLNKFFGILRFF